MTKIHQLKTKLTIHQALEDFLRDQQDRLSKKSQEKYKSIVELYKSYLNEYAHQGLTQKEREYFEEQYNNHDKEFCELFGPDKILNGYNEFFGYFLPKKVIAGEDYFKSCGTVLKKLARWLEEKRYAVPEDSLEAVETSAKGGKDAAEADKIGSLLYELAQNFPLDEKLEADDDDFIEGYFIIHKVQNNILYLQDDENPDEDVYQVKIPAKLAGKLKTVIGWRVWLALVRTSTKGMEKWYIAEVGNVYPT